MACCWRPFMAARRSQEYLVLSLLALCQLPQQLFGVHCRGAPSTAPERSLLLSADSPNRERMLLRGQRCRTFTTWTGEGRDASLPVARFPSPLAGFSRICFFTNQFFCVAASSRANTRSSTSRVGDAGSSPFSRARTMSAATRNSRANSSTLRASASRRERISLGVMAWTDVTPRSYSSKRGFPRRSLAGDAGRPAPSHRSPSWPTRHADRSR